MSDLGLHCLHMSHKKDARRIWVNYHVWFVWFRVDFACALLNEHVSRESHSFNVL